MIRYSISFFSVYFLSKNYISLCVLKIRSGWNVSYWSECENPSLMRISSLPSLRGIRPADAPPLSPSRSILVSPGILRGSSPQCRIIFERTSAYEAAAKAGTFRAPSYLAKRGGICCWLLRKNGARRGAGGGGGQVSTHSPNFPLVSLNSQVNPTYNKE